MQRKVPVGAGGTGTSVLGSTVGSTGGVETHRLTIDEMPSHYHVQGNQRAFTSTTFGGNKEMTSYRVGNFGIDSDALPQPNTEKSGGDQPHNNIQPSMVLNYIIKY
jgi:microcystin-dependent protein